MENHGHVVNIRMVMRERPRGGLAYFVRKRGRNHPRRVGRIDFVKFCLGRLPLNIIHRHDLADEPLLARLCASKQSMNRVTSGSVGLIVSSVSEEAARNQNLGTIYIYAIIIEWNMSTRQWDKQKAAGITHRRCPRVRAPRGCHYPPRKNREPQAEVLHPVPLLRRRRRRVRPRERKKAGSR